MMKRLLAIILIFALISAPTIALAASSIVNARYFGVIQISNNSTAETFVATTCGSSINTTNLIAGGYLNAGATNCAVRSGAGADVAFQPGYEPSGNPWCLWVPSIGDYGYLNDILYTANSTGGKIRYFPGLTGMSTPDNDATLEQGDNFTIEQSGWVTTTFTDNYSERNLVNKESAFKTYVSASGNITSVVIEGVAWTPPDGFVDGAGAWAGETNLYDDNIATEAYDLAVGAGQWSEWLELTHAAMPCDAVRYYTNDGGDCDNIQIDVWYGGGWNNIFDGAGTFDVLKTETIGSIESVTAMRFRMRNKLGGAETMNMSIIDFYEYQQTSVTAANVATGNHTVRTMLVSDNLSIWIDNVMKDSIVSAGLTVSDNESNWAFLENDVMPWAGSDNLTIQQITIGGTLRQHIQWEYDDEFTDLSGNSNPATPSFRTASSDPHVSAELISFQPVSEAKAPDYVLGEAPAFIDPGITGNVTGTFTTTPGTGTFPLANVIAEIATATDTPEQLPLLIIAVFVILAASLSVSATMRRYGSGSILVKTLVIAAIMGIFVALGNFAIDFWMIVVFLVIAVALAFASKQLGWS